MWVLRSLRIPSRPLSEAVFPGPPRGPSSALDCTRSDLADHPDAGQEDRSASHLTILDGGYR
jgi:hypothetical protein